LATKDKLAFGVEPSDRRYRLRLARYKALAETIAAYAREGNPRRPLKLLDVGAGNGRTLRYLEAEGVAAHIEFHGVDLSPKRLVNVYRPERWSLVQANVEHGLPFDTASFDVVVCEQVLEHLHDPQGVVDEIARVLKPDGLLIAGVPSFPPVGYWIRKRLVPWIDRRKGRARDHVQVFTSRMFAAMFPQELFEIRDKRGFRWITGGLLAPLEDFRLWYRYSLFMARLLPWLCTETQVVARRKPASVPQPSGEAPGGKAVSRGTAGAELAGG
jgi:SAM-dependent methyltransferase